MLPYEVIKYNIAQYMDLEDIVKINDDIFQYYFGKDPTRDADYLCSIQEEQQLLQHLSKNHMKVQDYIQHCWETSAKRVEFMTRIFGYFSPKSQVPIDIVVEFMNLDVVHSLENSQIRSLISMLTPKHAKSSTDTALKVLPFIRRSLQYPSCLEASSLYHVLDSDSKIQLIGDLQEQNIRHSELVWYLNNDEIKMLINRNKNLSAEVLKECLTKLKVIRGAVLGPIVPEDHRLVSDVISRYADAPKDKPTRWLEKPTLIRRCKYVFVRGQKTGSTCTEQAILGDIYCRRCCRKKSLPIPSFY